MKNRIMSPSPMERRAFGLVAWLEQTRIVLPLKGVECSFSVCGDVVSVEIDQIFHQNNPQPLDCLYTFPLPAGAAVYRCEMHVNGRLVRARVEEREAARRLAAEKKAAGYRTALVEMERDNLFTLSLGNVQPDDLVVIRFAYFQTLTRLGDWTSFSIPFCPGVRYIPGAPLLRPPSGRGVVDDTDQVPDASRISPPRIEKLHPDAAYLSVEGEIEHPLGEVEDISSPTHPVLVRPASGSSTVTLADETAVPDSDFVVRWTETTPQEARLTGWMTRQGEETFGLARFCAPREAASADQYAQDFYFLIDRSGSMQGLKWKKAVEAFREFLNVLGENDRVWATFFNSESEDLAEKPMLASTFRADGWIRSLDTLDAAGGTELLPALEHVLEKITKHSGGNRPVSLLLITDGEVGNEADVLKRLARHRTLRVDVFGIDVTINDGFLNKLAAQHQGTACLMSPTDDIAGAVTQVWWGVFLDASKAGGQTTMPTDRVERCERRNFFAAKSSPKVHSAL
jgi:Ca-activated chloride channel family protein